MYLFRLLSLSSVFRCWQNGSRFAQPWVILRKNGNKKAVSFLRDCFEVLIAAEHIGFEEGNPVNFFVYR